MNTHAIMNQLEAIIKSAGAMVCEGRFHSIRQKGGSANIVTDVDEAVQNYLIDALGPLVPGAGFIAEESEAYHQTEGHQWVIDPIDGTTNFAYGYRHSAISIALICHNGAQLAMVYQPYSNELFSAVRGQGAFLNGQRIHAAQHCMEDSLFLCGTTPYDKGKADRTFARIRQFFLEGRDIRRSGSAVLDLCYLAAGRADGFYEETLSPWDYAAGALIAQEAGAIVESIQGEWTYAHPIGIIGGTPQNIGDIRRIVHMP